ncbi:Outer membrane protein, OmpA/MotB family protein [Sulfitobacter noctilucicola]|uniref:Outer membrane protein OmpA-like peptidoglycan-associated protein n=1 Tax=Sulfitobacter noctilucicola TaxID=1342301 RepID=A0A7W6MBB2_9RHOB|nr:OmpA family protein [Sulfitobacter noctilucicola]KIN66361.1 Outer membrane protein, OmpA/MotB family protein [Sulfitobacter noctilucicola]MBB4175711.1 outer membrane protein OmpA-like peptidoglycan-associated protein [Sulfitobacter noctilucicola]
MKTLLKSSTAIGVSIAMALPTYATAQDFDSCAMDGDQILFPCLADNEIIRSADELNALIEAAGGPLQTEETGAAEDVLVTPTDEAAAQAEADAAAAAQAEADAAAAAQAETDAAAAAQAEADAAAAAQAEADAAAAAQAEADTAAQAEAEAAAAAQAQADADAEARAEMEANAAAAAEAEAARLAAEEVQAEADRAALREARAAERQAELDAAAAAAAAAAEGQGNGEVVTEEVTENEVRSSDQEFETAVTGTQEAAENNDDDGLSKFEKALLLGLGAVVVGSVLKNGDKVLSRSGDRVVVEDPNGDLRVLKDDDALLRRPGDQVETETFADGSSRSIVNKPDGSRVVTVRGRDGTVLRRVNIAADGTEYVLFDDLVEEERVVVNELPQVVSQSNATVGTQDENALRAALEAEMNAGTDRRFSLRQVRDIKQVRALAPELELDAVRFATGSAAIRPEQARSLAQIGRTLSDLVRQNPRTVILVEGHTDAVGSASYNLALSDRRAETVALALTEYFDVPPENMVTQGYGESALKVLTLSDEAANRRAVVRNITSLLR